MQPTSNEQRRDVADGLRLLDVSDIGDDDSIVVDNTEESATLFMRILEIANDYRAGLHYFPSHFVARDAVDLFADLIDRPTCKIKGTYDDEYGIYDHLTCGHVAMRQWPEPTNYCPDCGAEVIHDA